MHMNAKTYQQASPCARINLQSLTLLGLAAGAS